MATKKKTKTFESYQQKNSESYNEEIREIPEDKSTEITLVGKRLLVRPFKLKEKSESGLVLPNRGNSRDEETGKMKVEDIDYPFQLRGVVCNISSDCSDNIKDKLEVGDIVYLSRVQWDKMEFLGDVESLQTPDKEYFTADVPEGLVVGIEKQGKETIK